MPTRGAGRPLRVKWTVVAFDVGLGVSTVMAEPFPPSLDMTLHHVKE